MKNRLKKFLKTKTGKLGIGAILFVILWLLWQGLNALGVLQSVWDNRTIFSQIVSSPLFVLLVLIAVLAVIWFALHRQDWLYKLAEQQKANIGNYVYITSISCRYSNSLDSDPPEIHFDIDVDNSSVFEVMIDGEHDGDIVFHDRTLTGSLKISKNSSKTIPPLKSGKLYLIQRLDRDDREFMTPKVDTLPDKLFLNRLYIDVKLVDEEGELHTSSFKISSNIRINRR